MTVHPASISRGSLEELGLYNVLTRVALGDPDVDRFLLATLREKGFVDLGALALTEAGMRTLRALTVRLGWFYPEVSADSPAPSARTSPLSADERVLVPGPHQTQ